MEISDFSLPYMNGGRAWLQPIGQEYELEEVHILRRAHVALHPNITRLEHHNDSCFVFDSVLQTAASCFHKFLGVWNPS